MGKQPNHPQISPELTAKPHTRAASTERLPKEGLPLLTHGLEHPQGRMCKGAKQSRLGRGAFSISSAHVAQMREGGLQHQPSTSRTHLQLPLPEQTQPTAIYSLLRHQQGQQPANKPTNNEGGSSGNPSGALWPLHLFMFLHEHTFWLCHHIQHHISSSHILKVWSQPVTYGVLQDTA